MIPPGSAATVVGSGPNGLAGAIVLAGAGLRVSVLEAAETIGGGAISEELTLPGFIHDPCSAIHPLARASPFFEQLPLGDYGLVWVHPPVPLAHPLDGGEAVLLERSVEATARGLDSAGGAGKGLGTAGTGRRLGADGAAWQGLFGPLVENWEELRTEVLAPFHVPAHPLLMARFGMHAVRSARGLADALFEGRRARALFAGLAAHSNLSLDISPSAAFALVLGLLGHAVGWPFPRGGSGRISDALAAHLRELGGEIHVNTPVSSLTEVLDESAAVLCDVSPRGLVRIADDRLPPRCRDRLLAFRHGPGAFKVDWALDGPVPWRAAECARAGTLHLGGTFEEIADAEDAAWNGRVPERPFVLFAQQSLFDDTRAPAGRHTAWGYCHVPNGSEADMTERIEAQVERFAPGFRDRILQRHVAPPAALERRNANLVGGDVTGGAATLGQLFARPRSVLRPYAMPIPAVFLCSASTPPGGGVHGMCGYHAARAALRS